MMPGENQAKTAGVAPDGTAGTCQNCAVLNETLHEYITSFLALKQKIIETDKILNEFREKCDELQKTQRENAELHRHVDELLLNMAPFDSIHKDDVCMQEELQRTKGFLKRCQDGTADLMNRDPEAQTLKDRVIFQLKILQDSHLKQSTEVTLLKKENEALECKLQKTQEKLEKLEKEVNKEKKSSGVQTERKEQRSTVVQTDTAERHSTAVQTDSPQKSSTLMQTDPTEESKMDLGKIRQLVTDLWQCVQPESLSEALLLHGSGVMTYSSGTYTPSILPVSQAGVPVPTERLQMSPVPPSPTVAVPRTPVRLPVLREESLLSVEEVLDLFRLLPPLLSPVPSPVHQRTDEEDLKISDEEEEEEEEVKEEQCHRFKEEDVKEAGCLTNGDLKKGSQVCSPETPAQVKFRQSPPTHTQDQTTDQKAEASMNRRRSPAASTPMSLDVPGESEGCGEEDLVIDEVNEVNEVVRDEVVPSAEVCRDGIADMEWDPSPVDSLSSKNQNGPEGAHSGAAAGAARDPHHGSGLEVTNGAVLPEPKMDNTELKHSPVKTGPATLESVKDKEMVTSNGEQHEEQTSLLKPSLTDFAEAQKPQAENQIVKSKKCTGEVLRSESLNGLWSSQDQNHTDGITVAPSGVEEGGDGDNHDPVNSGIDQKQNPHGHIHDMNSTPREELQNGMPQKPSNEIRHSDMSECEAQVEKLCEVGCVDTESSEDMDYPGLQRKVRVAHSRQEAQQSAGGVNCSSKKEELKDKTLKDLACSIDIKSAACRMDHQDNVEDRSGDKDTDIMTNQNKNIDPSCLGLGDAFKNGFNAPLALESKDDLHPEVEQQAPQLPQETQDKICERRDDSCIGSPNKAVTTNDSSTLRSLADGAVHTNGFGASNPPSEGEGCYTKVKESPRPVPMATPTPTAESLQNVLSMMGPPLRPLLLPLLATPPRALRSDNPFRPMSAHAMALSTKDFSEPPSASSALRNGHQKISFSPAATTPSPCKSIPSSPLQFGSATPKHAVPVPCRHPVSTLNPVSPASALPQENSMQMLDSMYPELSAQARTLNILRGNVSLGRPAPEPSTPPQSSSGHVPSGFNSVATAFTKTQHVGKRSGSNVLLPKSAKKLRLGGSPVPVSTRPPSDLGTAETPPPTRGEPKDPQTQNDTCIVQSKPTVQVDNTENSKECIISQALTKIESSCFDLLVVVKSHVFVKRISSVPILRDEEKEVVSDFCTKHKSFTEDFLSAILAQLKARKATLGGDRLQSLCRVYTALCRQSEDRLKAKTLAYSLLKEDFPDAAKLILFMVTTWPSLLSCGSGLCKAIHAVAHKRAEGEVLHCLTAYLSWDSKPPCDVPQLISSTLAELRTGAKMQFQHHSHHGDDLCPTSWEYIFTLDLLCAHQKWKWTHDIIISKELWPIMNAWVTQPRSQKGPIQDVTVAAVLRLIGRLGQQGMKEKYSTAVCKIATVINMVGRQAHAEGVPWEVQLAAAYAIYDLSPSNPKEALAALADWRGEVTRRVPPGITSCLTQISSLHRKASP